MPACGVTLLFRLEAGRLLARRVPCRTKACPTCGPRLREQWAGEWGHAMGGDPVHRLVVDEGEWALLRRRKVMRTAEYGVIPGPDGTRVVYTTAELGEGLDNIQASLAADFAAMPPDSRHRILSANWRKVVDDARADARPEPVGECLGRLRRDLAHVAMVAEELGLLVGRGPDVLVLAEPPDPPTWARFCGLVGLYRRRARGEVRAA
jgi:hypothetical protein